MTLFSTSLSKLNQEKELSHIPTEPMYSAFPLVPHIASLYSSVARNSTKHSSTRSPVEEEDNFGLIQSFWSPESPGVPIRGNWFRILTDRHSRQARSLCPNPHPWNQTDVFWGTGWTWRWVVWCCQDFKWQVESSISVPQGLVDWCLLTVCLACLSLWCYAFVHLVMNLSSLIST